MIKKCIPLTQERLVVNNFFLETSLDPPLYNNFARNFEKNPGQFRARRRSLFVSSTERMRAAHAAKYGAVSPSLFPSLYSSLRYFSDFPQSHVELRRGPLMRSSGRTVISIHFAGILMSALRERERENALAAEQRNPIISLAGCHVGAAVTRQVFSFITYESGRRPSFQPTVGSNRISQTRRGNRIHAEPAFEAPRGAFRRPRVVFFPIDLPGESISPRHLETLLGRPLARTSRDDRTQLSVANHAVQTLAALVRGANVYAARRSDTNSTLYSIETFGVYETSEHARRYIFPRRQK